jgi:hypothetical protein
MKAFTVLDIFGYYMAFLEQRVERRGQSISHRGPVLITMSKRPFQVPGVDIGQSMFAFAEWAGPRRGRVFAEARIANCLPFREALAMSPTQALRCCSSGGYAWILEDFKLIEPWPVKGKLGLFELQTPREAREEAARMARLTSPEGRWEEI